MNEDKIVEIEIEELEKKTAPDGGELFYRFRP